MINSLQDQVSEVAERITHGVLALPEIDAADDPALHHEIYTAVHNAMRVFVDQALGREAPMTIVEDLFRKLGYREAARGRDRKTIDRGLQVAVAEIFDELGARAADNELSAGALNALNEAVTTFVDHLTTQLSTGYDAGVVDRDQDTGVARARLLSRLLAGDDAEEILAQAAIAKWEIPDAVTVLAVQVKEGRPLPADVAGDDALTRPGATPQTVVCATDVVDDVVDRIRGDSPRARIAVCWPVPPSDVPAAWRWALRALMLVESKVIPARPVIDCLKHRTEIWLHAEPVLRRQLAQDLLQPLFGETANSREILSETLLVWLETRDSAPAIASRLGVHPQTVRYRWKRINELFGDDLHDPDFVIQLTMVLKASVPLWVAGDQSDFERYQSSQDPGDGPDPAEDGEADG